MQAAGDCWATCWRGERMGPAHKWGGVLRGVQTWFSCSYRRGGSTWAQVQVAQGMGVFIWYLCFLSKVRSEVISQGRGGEGGNGGPKGEGMGLSSSVSRKDNRPRKKTASLPGSAEGHQRSAAGGLNWGQSHGCMAERKVKGMTGVREAEVRGVKMFAMAVKEG